MLLRKVDLLLQALTELEICSLQLWREGFTIGFIL